MIPPTLSTNKRRRKRNMDARARFKETYLAHCSQLGVDPINVLLSDESSCGVIRLSGQTLASKGCRALAAALRAGGTVHHIELCNSYINDEGCVILCESLLGTAIETLNLARNNFGSDSADAISKVVRTCTNLKKLILNWNSIGSRSNPFNNLCESLSVSVSLQEIDLQNNKIGPDCTAGLCRLIESSTSVVSINLGWNRIGGAGGHQIARTLSGNQTITFLQLAGNDIDYNTLVTIDDKVQSNSGRKRETEMSSIVLRQQREFQQALSDNADRLKSELELRDAHVVAERQRSLHLSDQYEQIALEKQRLETKLQSAQHDLSETTNELNKLKEDMRQTASSSEDNIKALQAAHAEEQSTWSLKVEDLQTQLHQLQQANQTLCTQQKGAQADISNANDENKQLQDDKRSLTCEVQNFKSKEQETQFKIKQLESTISRHKQEIEDHQQTIKNQQERIKDLEDQFWAIDRKHASAESQLQHHQSETERKISEVRAQCEADKQADLERSHRKLKELQDDVLTKDRLHDELKQDMLRMGERHQKTIDEIEERGKKSKDLLVERDLEIHRLTSLMAQIESEKRRIENELRSAESTRENLTREMENNSRQTQGELDRLTERFTADRMHLEMKVLQRDEKIQNLDSQNLELSQKLKNLSDETSREKERLLRRVTEQVRVIFDESG